MGYSDCMQQPGKEAFMFIHKIKTVFHFRLLALASLLLLCLMLSGCVKGELAVKIKTDGTADIAMNATIDDSTLQKIGQEDLPEQIASELRKQGFETEAITEGEESGLRASRTVKLDADREFPEVPGVTVQSSADPGLFFTKRHFVVTADAPELIPNESSSFTSFLGSKLIGRLIENQLDFNFKLTLPIKAEQSNADEISDNGKTLTWHLAATGDNRFELTLNVPNIRNILYAASAVLLVVIAAIVFFVLRRKRKKKQALPLETPMEPDIRKPDSK
ncbi:hypothetical protein B9G55_18375 [Saccharibacillus sp. O16]|nr:hypothetical protein B9G55_18375 [Saccharibacillus sp. O16]